jgi:hypothetical protein
MDKLKQGAINSITSNPLGAVTAGIGLVNSMRGGGDPTAASPVQPSHLKATADRLLAEGRAALESARSRIDSIATPSAEKGFGLVDQGTGLTGYLGTGKLPPEMQTQLDLAVKDAKLKKINDYAARGMPTDPMKNSALRDELADLDRRAIAMSGELAKSLATSGTDIIRAGTGLTGQAGNVANTEATIANSMVNQSVAATGMSADLYMKMLEADQKRKTQVGNAISNLAAALAGRPPQMKTA